MKQRYTVGDLVVLKSGGPGMVISASMGDGSAGEYEVAWYHQHHGLCKAEVSGRILCTPEEFQAAQEARDGKIVKPGAVPPGMLQQLRQK